MSNASRSGRWLWIIIAVVVGILVGSALGLYVAYAMLPPDLVLRDGSPRFLRYDPNHVDSQYRDYYVTRVAKNYADTVAGNPDGAWREAQSALGMTLGDATPLEGLKMLRDAEQVASNENKVDGANGGNPDARRFTLADENNLKALGDKLEASKDQPIVVPQAVIDAKNSFRLYGGLALALLSIALLGALFFLASLFARAPASTIITSTTATTRTTERVAEGTSATFVRPARAEELMDIIEPSEPDPLPTEPGIAAYAPAATVAPVRASSSVAGETPIKDFHSTYHHGMERYDESFEISSAAGDLVGECGATIEHRFGLDVPARVTALTVWVFDKPDFQSTSRVLATPFAMHTDSVARELSTRGELVEAKPGTFEVVTTSLRVEVDVRNLVLRPIEGIEGGYIDSVDLDFRVFKRA